MAAGDLCTVAAVKAALGLKADDPAPDVLLGSYVTGASGWVEQFCNQPLAQTTTTRAFDGRGGTTLLLPYSPVIAITALSVNGVAVDAASVGGTDTGYFYTATGIVRLRGLTFSRGIGNVGVTWEHGYATTPADLERAVVSIVCWRYKERDRIGQSSKAIGPGGETISYLTAAAAADVLGLLRTYQRVAYGG